MTEAPAYKILLSMFPSLVGALISLNFLPKDAGTKNRVVSFLSSLGIAHFLGRGISEHYGLIEGVESAVIFTTGVVGLTVVSHLISEIPKTFSAIRNKYFGLKK